MGALAGDIYHVIVILDDRIPKKTMRRSNAQCKTGITKIVVPLFRCSGFYYMPFDSSFYVDSEISTADLACAKSSSLVKMAYPFRKSSYNVLFQKVPYTELNTYAYTTKQGEEHESKCVE